MAKVISIQEKNHIIRSLALPDFDEDKKMLIKDQLLKLTEKEDIEVWHDSIHNILIFDHKQNIIVVLEGKDPSMLLNDLIRSLEGKIDQLQANLGPSQSDIMRKFGFNIYDSESILGITVHSFVKNMCDPMLGKKVKAYVDKPLGFLHSYANQENVLNQGYFIDDEQNCIDCLIINEASVLDQFQGYIIGEIKHDDVRYYLINAEKSYLKDDIIKQLGPWKIYEETITWLKEEA